MFKKSILASAVAFLLAAPAFSQDNGGGFKPQTGDITTEVQLNLFTENNGTISLDQIRGRYFLSPTSAFRLGFNLSSRHAGNDDVDRTFTQVGIAPGLEKHFAGTDRLSPYIGAELTLNKAFAGEEGPGYEIVNRGEGTAFFSYGLRAVAGADFYVARRLYLGLEFGLGFEQRNYGKVERKQGNNTFLVAEEHSDFTFGSMARGIRVGFVF